MPLTNHTDWSAASNTTIAAGLPPQAGSSSVGGGSSQWTDYGITGSFCLFNIQSGVLSNTRTNSPGSSADFPANGLIRQSSEDFQDGEAWCIVNSGSSGGLIGRFDRTSKAGIGISYQGGTFYIEGRKETGDAFLFDTTTVSVTVPSSHVLHLRMANISATSISLVGEIHTTSVDTAAPTAATRLFQKILTIDVSNTDRDVLAGSGGWGVGNIGAGEWTKFWSYGASATLTKGDSSADIIASKSVRFSYTAATGGTGTKTFSLVQDGTVVVADIGTTGTYTRTGLSPGTTYNFKIRCTDGAGTVVDYDTMAVRTLASNAIVIGLGIDSNQANNYGISYLLKAANLFKESLIENGTDAVVVYSAIAGTKMQNWATTGLSLVGTAVTNDWEPMQVNTVISQGGTNDAKVDVAQRTKAQFKADALNVATYCVNNLTASSLRVFFAAAPTIPSGAATWDATSATRMTEYLAAEQEIVAADTTGKIKMLDSAFLAESVTNAADWNLSTNDVHYNSTAHARQAALWLAGWPDPLGSQQYIAEGNLNMDMVDDLVAYAPHDTSLVTSSIALRDQEGFFVTSDGDVAVVTANGTSVTIPCKAYIVVRLRVTKILDTGTGATTVYVRSGKSYA